MNIFDTSTTDMQAVSVVTSFAWEGGAELRTMRDLEGHIWFVAKDVCKALDLTNTARALSRLDDDERGVTNMNTATGKRALSIISEPGVYALVMRSRKAEAKSFKRWVTHNVLPAIRGDGLYINGEEKLLEAATVEELQARLQELARIAAQGLELKAIRGLNALEEQSARREALKFINKGRKRRRSPNVKQLLNGGSK